MRVVHIAYPYVPEYKDPRKWLNHISFFTGILKSMSENHEVISVHFIDFSGILKENGTTYHFLRLTWWQRFFPVKFYGYIKRLQPEVIIVHGIHFPWQILLLGLYLHKNVIIFAQHHAERPLRYHKGFLQVLADKVVHGYFFSSVEIAKKWIVKGQIQSTKKIHEVMEASSSFYPIDSAEAKGRTLVGGNPVYLWVGRLDSNKDPETLLKAFIKFSRLNPEAKLYVIFQSNELLPETEALLEASNHIELVGRINHDDLLYWYNAADFIISTSHYEGSGIAVCEAMSCGCIPILSDIPSFRMMTKNGEVGILFKPGVVNELAEALMKSTSLHIDIEKNKVLNQFDENLSFGAISKKMLNAISKTL